VTRPSILWLWLVVIAPAQACAAAGEAPLGLEGFDDFVAQVMAEWQVPGLAVAAVKDGEVVVCRTYGLRDPERGLPVTKQTLFAIGSVTKTFTATGLAIMADEGRLDWDRPVRGYLPDFALMDPRASRAITPRDLVSHRSGLPRHDVLWYAEAFDRAEMLRRLRHLEPTKALGETFQYQNLMFMAAGVLAGRLAGMTWEDFTRRRLLAPLGMTSTRLSLGAFLAAPEIALPYFPGEAGREAIAFRNTDEIAPAGGLYSSITDMLRYLRFHLANGRLDGRQILSPAGAKELRRVQIRLARAGAPKQTGTEGYGLGFYVARYRGHRVVRHGGAIDGYLSRFSFMPEDGLGLVVLSNLSGGNPVPRLVAYNLYDPRVRRPSRPTPRPRTPCRPAARYRPMRGATRTQPMASSPSSRAGRAWPAGSTTSASCSSTTTARPGGYPRPPGRCARAWR
jgi:CubicO group peptidase (beta-lactamase class C family)